MSGTGTRVPDLLRRFAPTPHSARVWIKGVEIELQTDDVEIVAIMQRRRDAAPKAISSTSLLVKVIRDHNCPTDGSNITVISAPPLTTFVVGTNTVLMLDCERREILGFLASSVSAQRFADELLPNLLDRLKNAEAPEPIERASGHP